MDDVQEIQKVLKHLPSEAKWKIAQWLLNELHYSSTMRISTRSGAPSKTEELPNYAERRKRIFGDTIVPNAVLEAREQERW
jgi:hypothetical protein